jgi:magnesium transporter
MSASAIGDQTIANMRAAQEAACRTAARVMARPRSVICFAPAAHPATRGMPFGIGLGAMAETDLPHHYKRETAGHLALRRVPVVPATESVGSVRGLLRSGDFESVDLVLLTNPSGSYVASVELRRLVEADDATALESIGRSDWPVVPTEMDQEQAVDIAIRQSVTVLPVIAVDGRPIGLIPAHMLLDVLGREHNEDLYLMAGIVRESAGARHALEDPPLRRVVRRLPWLLAGLVLSSAATAVMVGYETALQTNVMIAFFIPGLVYLTDAIGTQTEAIAVRGLSVRSKPLLALLWSEIVTGGTIGVLLGLAAMLAVWFVFGNIAIAAGVGVSLAAAGILASGIGLLFPWTLSRIGLDPAFGAGPVATIVQDVLTIVIYFLVMTKVVGLGL